jgi:hypothetical protein
MKRGTTTVIGGVMAIALAAITGTARAGLIILEPVRDNTLYESATGALSNGAGSSFHAGKTATGKIRRGLLAFDVASAIPADSVIVSAKLTLFVSQSSSGDATVSLHRVLSDWGEGASDSDDGGGGGGAPAEPGDATWLHTFWDDQFWSQPGGDFDPLASAAAVVGGINFYTWDSTPQLVADVQAWLDAPASAFGWLVMGDESMNQTAKRFESREQELVDFRPKLEIEYQAVPAPGALAILGLAAASRRRRRHS